MRAMHERIDRREALKHLGAAGVGMAVAPVLLRGREAPITIAGRLVEIVVASVSPSMVRLTVAAIGGATPQDDGALVPAAKGSRPTRRREPFGAIKAGGLTVRFTPTPPTLSVVDQRGQAVQQIVFDASAPTVRFSLGKGPLLGFGEGGPQFDRKGAVYTNRNGQGGYRLRTHGGRVPIQWLASTDGWGLFVQRPVGAFNLTGDAGLLTPAEDALPFDLFVTAASDPKVLLAEYARITGLAELPPLWSFGYMQSHRTLAGPDEIASVARTFRAKKLPCDALIYLGTEFTPSGWNTRNGEFGWKAENFPDPTGFMREAHAQHYKVVLHTVIEGRRMGGTVSEPCTPDKTVPSGRTPDDQWPDNRAVPCYWPYHKPLMDLGVDGFWPDQGDGLDAASRLARIRMYWEGPQVYRPNERPFALHRNGAAGMQRYGAFLWSGDVYTTWETLKTHVPIAVNTGLSGIPFWGSDIGGFVPTAEYTGELHVRWFQFGTFCPSFRAHGRNWHLRLPWGWNLGKLPVSEVRGYTGGAANPDPAELTNTRVEPIVRKYPRAALPPPALHLHDRAPVHRDGSAHDARALAASPRRPSGGPPRRSVPVGARHPGLAGGGEGRHVTAPLSAPRRLVRLLDRGAARWGPRRRASRRPRDDAAARAGGRDPAAWPGPAVRRRARGGSADRRRLSGRGRRILALRGRRQDLRVSEGRVDGHRDGVERRAARVVGEAGAGVSPAPAVAARARRARGGTAGDPQGGLRRQADGGEALSDEQKALWNGPAGRAWVEGQDLLDRIYGPFADLLVEVVRDASGRRVLDVGCGTGGTTLAVARMLGSTGRVVGLDISAPMIAAAEARAERDGTPAAFICADAALHPFEPASFDVIISRFGVMFFDDPVATFASLRRAARDDARLRVIVWRSAAENPFMTTAERAAAPLLPSLPRRRPDAPGQFAFANENKVHDIMVDSGWAEIDIQPIDVTCVLPEVELVHYVSRHGPVGLALQEADEPTRARVIDTVRGAFDPYVHGVDVRFTAACWMVRGARRSG